MSVESQQQTIHGVYAWARSGWLVLDESGDLWHLDGEDLHYLGPIAEARAPRGQEDALDELLEAWRREDDGWDPRAEGQYQYELAIGARR